MEERLFGVEAGPTKPTPLRIEDTLVAHFVDTCRAQNRMDPPPGVKGAMAKVLGKLDKQGQPHDLLREAIVRVVKDGIAPKDFEQVVFQIQSEMGGISFAEREALRAFLLANAKHGKWPTGARFVRGTHSGTYISDPLGYDKLPGDYDSRGSGIHRPNREEVVEALRGRGA